MDKAFIKGLNLLVALAESDSARGLTDLALQLGLTKSNTHRLLATLVAQGFATQEKSGRYKPTLRLWELGSRIVTRIDVVEIARPHMAALAKDTDETVHLSVLDGREVVYLDKIEGAQAVRSYTRIGARAPAWCVATGKILLAYRDRSEIEALAPHLSAFTPRSFVDAASLGEELAQARRQGVAFNRGEWREDVVGVAAPILDASGEAVAAIGISGPSSRLGLDALQRHAAAVLAAGQAISRENGFLPAR